MIIGPNITGITWGGKTRSWKICQWCNNTFLPHANRQTYCDDTCRELARTTYKRNWMYHYRKKIQNGEIIDPRSILNVGTGNLGQHRLENYDEEHEKILEELNKIGLR